MRPDTEGPAAPPRRNGELVFEAPWEARVFGIVMALCEAEVIAYEDFRRHLIAEIAAWERAHSPDDAYRYYERWLAALERVMVEQGLCAGGVLDVRVRALAARPHGHDHGPV